jgi:hypothetical protein
LSVTRSAFAVPLGNRGPLFVEAAPAYKRAASDWPAAYKNEARRIAANIAKLPGLLLR